MDKQKILTRYKKEKNLRSKYKLADGGIVVGSEVDEDNHLLYIIKRKGEYTIEKAQGIRPVEDLITREQEHVYVENGKVVVSEK